MKVIITESQLNTLTLQESKWWDTAKEIGTKLFNETLIKEELQYEVLNKIIKHLKRDAESSSIHPSKRNIINNYGLQRNDVDYLHKLEEEAIDRIKGVLFDVKDFNKSVGIGGYDFKFVVRGLYGEEYTGVDTYGIADEDDTFPQVNWTVEATVLLRGATVELMGTGETIKLETAIDNPDYGWEIESEIGDIISDIIYVVDPILKAVGAHISIDQSYE